MSPKHAAPEPPETPESAPELPEPDPQPPEPAPRPQDPQPPEPAPQPPEPAPSAPPRPATARPRRRPPTARSRWLWALLALLGIGLVAWLIISAVGGGPGGQPGPTTTPSAGDGQQTLLIQVRNDDDFGSDNLVAAAGSGLPAAQLLVPSQLIVDVPGAGQQTLGQSARLLDRTASQDALSDLLALRIDGTLSLGRLALAGMVDFVGGITVTVDQPVVVTDEETGAETVLVPAGTQLLNGTQAAAYALAWLPGEPEAARLARYSTVMTRTVASLPPDALRVEQMLTSLGGSARTTTSTAAVAGFLLQMREGINAGGQQVRVLPTTDIEAGSGLEVVRVDLAAADLTLASLMPQAVLDPAESNPRVLVQNGVGTPGLGASARDRLVAAGMVYINGGNAEQFDQPETLVLVEDTTERSQQLGATVAEALGVPATAVTVSDDGQNVADAVVILGVDFEP